MHSILNKSKMPALQRAMSLLFLMPAILYLGVALEIIDISWVAYSRCRTCPRTEIPSILLVRLVSLMFFLFSFAMLAGSFAKQNVFANVLGSAAWLLFCGLLMRHAFFSNDQLMARAMTGALSSLFLFSFIVGWGWQMISHRQLKPGRRIEQLSAHGKHQR